MGILTLFLGGFLRGHDIDWPTTNFFWNIGHSPIEAPLWTTSSKIETNVALYSPPFQFIHTRVEPLGKTIWDKCEVLFGRVLGNNLGTSCEHIGTYKGKNEKKKNIIPPSTPPNFLMIFYYEKMVPMSIPTKH